MAGFAGRGIKKEKKGREERLVEERISKITQRTKQGRKTGRCGAGKEKPEEAEDRVEKIVAEKKGTVRQWEFATRDNIVCESGLVAFCRHTESRDCGREREASTAEWC